jgi:hypothetical protein
LQQRWARMPRNLAARMNENTISALTGVNRIALLI